MASANHSEQKGQDWGWRERDRAPGLMAHPSPSPPPMLNQTKHLPSQPSCLVIMTSLVYGLWEAVWSPVVGWRGQTGTD